MNTAFCWLLIRLVSTYGWSLQIFEVRFLVSLGIHVLGQVFGPQEGLDLLGSEYNF
jgi:hypothetical protein